MTRTLPLRSAVAASVILFAGTAGAEEALRFPSCKALAAYLDTRPPDTTVRLARADYECREPLNPSVDGLDVDFGGSVIRVADQALRPGIVVGDLHSPPQRRRQAITVRNVTVEGNRANQLFECWAGPCDPAVNDNVFRQQRLNGITVNGCDDCALHDVRVSGARSGGVVVVASRRLLIDGLEASDAHYDGLAAYWTEDSVFRNVHVHDNGYSGFSFDLRFSGNRIEHFRANDNRDHGLFIRDSSNNTFVHGTFADNRRHGVYLDRARPDEARTCASQTRFEDVAVMRSGQYAVWLNFDCAGNALRNSRLIGNGEGCLGGREAARIGLSADSLCVGPQPETPDEADSSAVQG